MNIKKLSLGNDKFALVNFDNVTEVHERVSGGCDVYFNTMSTDQDQSYIQVEESMNEIELIINTPALSS